MRDDIIVLEVIAELDLTWWRSYRRTLGVEFAQDEILIRASTVTKL